MAVDSVATCPDERGTVRYETKRDFFSDSGTGVMAIMPHVKKQDQAKSEHTYVAFRFSGTYKLDGTYSQINDYWFVNNHRLGG